MPFAVVSGAGREMGVLDRGRDRQRGRGSFGGKRETSHFSQWGLCGEVILCREEWRRGSSQMTLGRTCY